MQVIQSNMKQQFSLFGKSRAASATIMSFFTSVVGDDLNQTGFDQTALNIVIVLAVVFRPTYKVWNTLIFLSLK